MNSAQSGTGVASGIAGAVVILLTPFIAKLYALMGFTFGTNESNAMVALSTYAISFWTHGDAVPSLADIKASVLADLQSAGKVVAAPATTAAAVLLAACLTVSACQSTNGTVANGWTAMSAANVTCAVADAIEADLKALEPQMPNQVSAIKAFGAALASGVETQVSAMISGSSAGQQTIDTAINAVLAALPNASGLMSAANTAGIKIDWLADLRTAVAEAPGVVSAVAKAKSPAGASAADLAASLAQLQADATAL